MTIDEMQAKRKELGYSYAAVSQLSGLSVLTVRKMLSGRTKHPRRETVEAMDAFFSDLAAGKVPLMLQEEAQETQTEGDRKSKVTVADYRILPAGRKSELIDGVLYDKVPSSLVHQDLTLRVAAAFRNYLDQNPEKGRVFTAPTNVQLDADNDTMLQPDISVVWQCARLTPSRVVGAPDLVAEVLSPASRNMDMFLKLCKYKEAGVREYWIVDPQQQSVIVYSFEKDNLVRMYTFDDKVPVEIWDGDCLIDFAPMKSALII